MCEGHGPAIWGLDSKCKSDGDDQTEGRSTPAGTVLEPLGFQVDKRHGTNSLAQERLACSMCSHPPPKHGPVPGTRGKPEQRCALLFLAGNWLRSPHRASASPLLSQLPQILIHPFCHHGLQRQKLSGTLTSFGQLFPGERMIVSRAKPIHTIFALRFLLFRAGCSSCRPRPEFCDVNSWYIPRNFDPIY